MKGRATLFFACRRYLAIIVSIVWAKPTAGVVAAAAGLASIVGDGRRLIVHLSLGGGVLSGGDVGGGVLRYFVTMDRRNVPRGT